MPRKSSVGEWRARRAAAKGTGSLTSGLSAFLRGRQRLSLMDVSDNQSSAASLHTAQRGWQASIICNGFPCLLVISDSSGG